MGGGEMGKLIYPFYHILIYLTTPTHFNFNKPIIYEADDHPHSCISIINGLYIKNKNIQSTPITF